MFNYNEIRSNKEIKAYYLWFHENYPALLQHAAVLLGKQEADFSIAEINRFGTIVKGLLPNGLELHDKGLLISEELANVFIAYYCGAWLHYFGGEWYYSTKKIETGYGFPQLIEYGPPGDMWSAISPYTYLVMTLKGTMEHLSEIFDRKLGVFERNGITDFKRKLGIK